MAHVCHGGMGREGQGSSLRMRFFLNRIEWQQGLAPNSVAAGSPPQKTTKRQREREREKETERERERESERVCVCVCVPKAVHTISERSHTNTRKYN